MPAEASTYPYGNALDYSKHDLDLSILKVELKWYKLAQNRQACRQLTATVRSKLGRDPD